VVFAAGEPVLEVQPPRIRAGAQRSQVRRVLITMHRRDDESDAALAARRSCLPAHHGIVGCRSMVRSRVPTSRRSRRQHPMVWRPEGGRELRGAVDRGRHSLRWHRRNRSWGDRPMRRSRTSRACAAVLRRCSSRRTERSRALTRRAAVPGKCPKTLRSARRIRFDCKIRVDRRASVRFGVSLLQVAAAVTF